MIRVHVICEGQTEETFIKELLAPHFTPMEIYLDAPQFGPPGHKGGRVNFDRLFTDLRNFLLADTNAYCTTFFDFYALPSRFPGKPDADRQTVIADKAGAIHTGLIQAIEAKLGSDPMRRFIPYVQMYEFEGLLFSNPEKFATGIYKPEVQSDFQSIRDAFSSPEEINDDPNTAPSKRVQRLVPEYQKPLQDVLAAIEIGLETIRNECHLFHRWLKQLESLKS